MQTFVLDSIPCAFDVDALAKRLRLREGRGREDLERLAQEGAALARPRAMYGVAYIEARGDDWVASDGVKLTSRALRVNLDPVHRFFPFVATCGVEVDAWAQGFDDLLLRFYADALCEEALRVARKAMGEDLVARIQPGHTSDMNPGSLIDWPIHQQRPLFALLGDTKGLLGVRLTDGFMMVPIKSVSGIRYPTETNFENCMLCSREGCPGRHAPYDKDKYEREYARR